MVVYIIPGWQPLPTLLTVSEYVVVVVGTITGVCNVELEPSEPVHDHAVALLELSLSVTELPLHTGLLFVTPVEDGTGLTVTTVVYTVDWLQPVALLLNVNEYVVAVAVGVNAGN